VVSDLGWPDAFPCCPDLLSPQQAEKTAPFRMQNEAELKQDMVGPGPRRRSTRPLLSEPCGSVRRMLK
jgi:hypothetical protein